MTCRYAVVFAVCLLTSAGRAHLPAAGAAGRVGIFDQHGDVGAVKIPGAPPTTTRRSRTRSTARARTCGPPRTSSTSRGRRSRATSSCRRRVEFQGKGVDPHRKVGLMVRASLDTGLAARQRRAPRRRPHGPAVPPDGWREHRRGALGIERARRAPARASRATPTRCRSPTSARRSRRRRWRASPWATNVYVGIYVCSHNADVSEKAMLRNVRLIRPARTASRPTATTSAATSRSSTWSPASVASSTTSTTRSRRRTGRRTGSLLMNRNGRMYGFDIATGAIARDRHGADDEQQQRSRAVVRRQEARAERRLALEGVDRAGGRRHGDADHAGRAVVPPRLVARRQLARLHRPARRRLRHLPRAVRRAAPRGGSPRHPASTMAPSSRRTAGGSTSTPPARGGCRCGA